MIYIVLNILASVLLLGIFKLFDKYKINTFHAIIVNYFAAASTGLAFSQNNYELNVLFQSSWIYICIPLGFLLISIFYIISLTTQKISISVASVANKMSVVMPVLFSVIILHETLNLLKILGIILALVALYFATFSESSSNTINKKLLLLPILVFVGSGLLDISINATKAFYIKSNQDGEMFTITSFAFAFIIGVAVLVYKKTKSYINKEVSDSLDLKSILGGIVLGIPNYFSIYFIIKALESELLSSAQLFPVLNIANVILSTLTGVLLFGEKLSAKNKLGVLIALVSIALITL